MSTKTSHRRTETARARREARQVETQRCEDALAALLGRKPAAR